MKAVDIIAASQNEISSLIARIGGIHWMMSTMGSIGYIMSGSGLEDLFEIVYAKGSITAMMSGHAYSRAFRAHLLASSACLCIFLYEVSGDPFDYNVFFKQLSDSPDNYELISKQNEMLTMADSVSKIINDEIFENRTLRLWTLYIRLTHLLRLFVYAERTGNFSLRLNIMELFIPIFHATGHILYARSTRVYIKEMKSLKSKIPEDKFHLFTDQGYFTIRRKEKYFAGNFSDLIIEQDLMRLFKSSGGMTRYRDITNNTITNFVNVMPRCIPICTFLESFTGVVASTSEQHKDLRPAN